jgi:surface polysaccharide O-acyltransferase-like enzyme
VLTISTIMLVRAGSKPIRSASVVLLLGVVTAGLPAVHEVTGWNPPPYWWAPAFYTVAYAVAGAVILALPRIRFRWVWWLFTAAGLVATVWWQRRIALPAPYGTPAVGLYTIGLLAALPRVRIPRRARPALVHLSDATFGVYLVHLMILQFLAHRLLGTGLDGGDALTMTVVLTGATVVLAFAASLAWGRLGPRRALG